MSSIIHRFGKVQSTNTLAMEMAIDGAEHAEVVLATEQLAGKGRSGRSWSSPYGGLYLSIILRPTLSMDELASLSPWSALALAKAIRKVCRLDPKVSWPNDVMILDKKVAGILLESSFSGGLLEYCVIGMGINSNLKIENLPSEVRDLSTTLLEQTKKPVDNEKLLNVLLVEFKQMYATLVNGESQALKEELANICSTLGRRVKVQTSSGTMKAKAVDITNLGELVVEDDNGAKHTITTGECIHLGEETE